MHQQKIHWFAILTASVTVFLIVAGATVTSTGSGDAVPDWPLSYGTLNPPMIGGIFYEHGHRLIAGLTGILVAILAFFLWRFESRKYVRVLGLAALIAVIIQATLGGLRVLLVSTESVQDAATAITGIAAIEPTRIGVSITHAFLAQSILCALFAIVLFTSKTWRNWQLPGASVSFDARFKNAALLLSGVIFLQLLAGALVRHTGAGLIIPDFPLSFGQLIPPFGSLPNDPNAPFPLTDTEFFLKVLVHFSHRLLAFIILGITVFLFMKYRHSEKTGLLCKLLLGLVCFQIVLGGINIWSGKSVLATVPHVVVGALTLATSIILSLWLLRFSQSAKQSAFEKESVEQREMIGVTNV